MGGAGTGTPLETSVASLSKASILTAVNAAFEQTYSGSDLDLYIQMALDDLAGMHALADEDRSQSLTGSEFYLDYPDACLDSEQAILTVVLADSSSVRGQPLKPIPGGWHYYNYLLEGFTDSARSTPTYCICRNRRIYVYPPPDGTYTATITYYKRHQDLADGIEFSVDWRNAIYWGVFTHLARMTNNAEMLALWEPRYLAERDRMRMRIPRDTAMIGN